MVDPDELATITQAIMTKIAKEMPGMTLTSGTVVADTPDPTNQVQYVDVHPDGDDDPSNTVKATNLINQPMYPGLRIKLLWVPPQGVYVLGVLGVAGTPAGRLTEVVTTALTSGAVDAMVFQFNQGVIGGMDSPDLSRLVVPADGMYYASARIQVDAGGCASTDAGLLIETFDSSGAFVDFIDETSVQHVDTGGFFDFLATGMLGITAGGWAQVWTTNTGGGPTAISHDSHSTHFDLHWVAPYAYAPVTGGGG